MSPDDFDDFFQSLHGYPPFAWQSRLARLVVTQRRWPRILNLPTSAGKTAAIDIAVFSLALEAEEANRAAPLRTFFVVDRRIVVDEAVQRAEKIRDKLSESLNGHSSVCREVAQRLRSLGGGAPLHVARLRGGIYRDAIWANSPVQPVVCVSTVDQVGSRLLFRGYGVSEYQRAIHAALIGNDSLIILDEAHLSQPFVETLESVEAYRGEGWAELQPATPFHIVSMSATAVTAEESFTLRPDERQDPELGRRLNARKPARLVEVSDESDDERANQTAFANRIAEEALKLAGLQQVVEASQRRRREESTPKPVEPARVIGVVVNRVALARQVFESLRKREDAKSILLTGRARPFDRDELLFRTPVAGGNGWLRFMEAKKDRPDLASQLFVVATQTVEVGANISFDALVTQAAPLDSLRQRFGRLDRLGLRGVSRGVVIARKSAVAAKANDPVYGNAVASTWKWLNQRASKGKEQSLDFGLNALTVPEDAETLAHLCAPRRDAAVLSPAHVDTLVQTSPTASPDLDLSLFLHGPDSGPADVQIVWRGDLPNELQQDSADDLISTVALVPPTSMEALSVPIWAARVWLTNRAGADSISDVEGEAAPVETGGDRKPPRPFLCWRGPHDSQLVLPRDADELGAALRPGDTIVVPSTYGGWDEFGWHPDSDQPARDIGDGCSLYARLLPVLRMHPGVLRGWQPDLADAIRAALTEMEDDGEVDAQALLDLARSRAIGVPWLSEAADRLSASTSRTRTVDYPETTGPGLALVATKRVKPQTHASVYRAADEGDFAAEDDTASLTKQVGLAKHCEDVERLAGEFACRLAIPQGIRDDLVSAAWLHDVGKADPRFQAWLRGGDRLLADAAVEMLAKSGMNPRNRIAIRSARERAGYPAGGRHEFLSVALVGRNATALSGANDPELVLYLIGSHHGRGRPFVPVVPDPVPVIARLTHGEITLEGPSNHRLEQVGSGWTERFWLMQRRYGYWGLALLEAIVQLADHRCSEAEEHEANE